LKDPEPHSKEWKNRQRTLILISRGIAGRFRHLVEDLMGLIPNTKREQKIDRKFAAETVDDICFERSCNNIMYFEQRKQKDLFMWIGKSPNGPSIKFLVVNIHTFDELKMAGNCLKFSRPLLSFDSGFEAQPHLRLMKEMLGQVFNTPKNHPKSKPFIDHVLSFNLTSDGRIWFRVYQIVNQHEEIFTKDCDIDKLVLLEVGPRMTLQPIKIFSKSLGGEALWQSGAYQTPSRKRSKKGMQYLKKREIKEETKLLKKTLAEEGADEDAYLTKAFV
jgi:ribosome biogenesis protein BRX1